MIRVRRIVRLLGVLFVVVFWACGDDAPGPSGVPIGTLAPEFSLVDVNPNSTTHDSTLSPRDYLEKVSAWYFGHST